MYRFLLKKCWGMILFGAAGLLWAMDEEPARLSLVIDIEKLKMWPDSQSDVASAQETVSAGAKEGASWDTAEQCAVLAELRDDIVRGRILVCNKDATLDSLELLIATGGVFQEDDEHSKRLLDELLSLTASVGLVKNRPTRITALVRARADVNTRDRQGSSPLHATVVRSIGFDQRETAQALIENRANPDARDARGDSPLHVHVRKACADDRLPDSIDLLLGAGASVNAQNNKGETPLHSPAGSPHLPGSPRVAKNLLAWGANPWTVNCEGQTPRALAAASKELSGQEEERRRELIKRLSEVGLSGGRGWIEE